jgi:hypothetical protein
LLLGGFFVRLLAYIGNSQIAALLALLFYIAVTYFAYISFGIINRYKTGQINSFLKHTMLLGWKNIGVLLFSYLLMFLVVVLFAGVVTQSVNSSLIVLISSITLLILAMNWGKIFFLTAVKNVDKKAKIIKKK